MEGRVFVCTWQHVGGRYRVWVKSRPRIAAEGDTFEEADEALWEAIAKATGDGENERGAGAQARRSLECAHRGAVPG